jgi:hypothetical protein
MSSVNDGVSVRIDDGSVSSSCEACGRGPSASNGVDAAGEVDSTISLTLTPSDTRRHLDLIRARGATIRRVVRALKPAMGLRREMDAGCGIGFFAQTLAELGLETRGFDGQRCGAACDLG